MFRCFGVYFFTYLVGISSLLSKPHLKIQQVHSINYPYIQVEISLANITPTIKKIDTSSFELYENDWKVNSFYVKKVEPHKNPKKIILLINSSNTLSPEHFTKQLTGVKNFIKVLNDNDQITVLSYNTEVIKHCDFTAEKFKMMECVKNIQRKGQKVVLYDAIFEGLKLSQNLSPERHSIILFTEGTNQGSIVEMNDIVAMLNQSNTPIFAVSTGNRENLKSIAKITRMSNGESYHVHNIENLSKIYLLINELLDNSYLIRYISQASSTSIDGKKVKLIISINSTDFKESDSYTFFLQNLSFSSFWRKLKTDNSYWLFGTVSILIFFVLSLLIAIIRRPKYIIKEIEKQSTTSTPSEEVKEEIIYNHDIENYLTQETELPTPSVKQTINKSSNQYLKPTKIIRAYLVEKEGPNTGHKYELNWENINIGYSDENSISLDDTLISHQHAKIKQKNNHFILYDLLSENGTYLNGKKLLSPSSLKDFDEIQLGKTKLIFRKVINPV